MGRCFSIMALGLLLALVNEGKPLAAPNDLIIKIDDCKVDKAKKGCRAVSAPEIDPAGGLIPLVLIAGTLLLVAESRRRFR